MPLRIVPHASPAAEVTLLYGAWGARSQATGFPAGQPWRDPAAEAVVDALLAAPVHGTSLGPLVATLRDIGRVRSEQGLSLDETFDDVAALAAVTPGARRRLVDGAHAVRAVAEGWSDGVRPVLEGLCTDALTGLATETHLRARLTDVHRVCEAREERADRAYAFVVVAPADPRHASLSSTVHKVSLAQAVRAAFREADTVAALPCGAVVVLAAYGLDLARALADLLRALGDVDRPHRLAPQVWGEALGRTLAESLTAVDRMTAAVTPPPA